MMMMMIAECPKKGRQQVGHVRLLADGEWATGDVIVIVWYREIGRDNDVITGVTHSALRALTRLTQSPSCSRTASDLPRQPRTAAECPRQVCSRRCKRGVNFSYVRDFENISTWMALSKARIRRQSPQICYC